MDEKEFSEFTLEDIIKEFSESESALLEEMPDAELTAGEAPAEETPEAEPEEAHTEPEAEIPEVPASDDAPAEEVSAPDSAPAASAVTDETIRLDTLDLPRRAPVRNAKPLSDTAPVAPQLAEEPFSKDWEPEYEQPIGEYIPPPPIILHPRSRLRELKRKLVEGPERRYYELSEKGSGKLQAAIFLTFLVVLLSAGATVLYALGMVQENRLRLMVFGQFLAMLLSALFGSHQMIEGVNDLLHKRFTLNTLLAFTFLFCCIDGVFCLRQVRVPCCAAFSLEVTMSLWSAFQSRNTELGQTDTMRKATHLDGIFGVEAYYAETKGLLRGEGQVEDFTDTYTAPSRPEKIISIYALAAFILSLAIGAAAGALHGASAFVQVTAVCLLAAVPATFFITLSRPMAVLERRLHALGSVLCGWQGVTGLCGKVLFPLGHTDLFPAGAIKMNGVKFYGSREPDTVVAYSAALITACGGGLQPLFTHLLDSRNGRHYDAANFRSYEDGGIGGEVNGEPVLMGTLSFLRQMGVEIPENTHVNQAVYTSIDGELSGLFAISYDKVHSAAAGLGTLCGYRKLRPVLTGGDFMLTLPFLRSKFGVNPRRVLIPEHEVQMELSKREPETGARAYALTTRPGLAPLAYAVTGARSLKAASTAGIVIHMAGGILGLAMMLVLTLQGALDLLTPANMFLYELVWMLPGLIITEWTRSI